MSSYLWEISVCFFESLLFSYLFYKKIGLRPGQEKRAPISVVLMSALLSAVTLLHVPLFPKMLIMLLVYILVALWAYDCHEKGRRHKAAFWAGWPLVLAMAADFITYSIALAVVDYPLEQLMSFSSARIQFALIYLLIIAFMVWGLTHLGEVDPQFPVSVIVILFVLVGIGIFAAESMIDIALALRMDPATVREANTLSVLGYSILLMLAALLSTFEYLSYVLRRNKKLEFQYQLAQIEAQQYQFMVSTAASLAEWKHDYQGQLRLIAALIAEENYPELEQFATRMDTELGAPTGLLFTGNRTMDAVISLRAMDARRHKISFGTKLYLPESLPLEDVYFSALIGNVLDNAIEACLRVPAESKKIYFEMKPFKKMLAIFCSNTSDGNYISGGDEILLSTKKAKGHGIGMRRIREIVEEAGGACQFSPEEDQFSVSIMIPLKEREDENCSSRRQRKPGRAHPTAVTAMGQGASNDP